MELKGQTWVKGLTVLKGLNVDGAWMSWIGVEGGEGLEGVDGAERFVIWVTPFNMLQFAIFLLLWIL